MSGMDDVVMLSVSKIYDRMGALHMSMTTLSREAGTNAWVLTRRGRTSISTAREIARVLHCQLSDITLDMTREENRVPGVFGPTCYESGKCFARAEDGSCKILRETYGHKEKRCPFRKENRNANARPCTD